MTEKLRNAWAEVNSEIGTCCLHRKSAFDMISKKPVTSLSLVTFATKEKVEEFFKNRKVTEYGNCYRFFQSNVCVDLTVFPPDATIEELNEKAFKQPLTIDSIGITFDGKYNDCYYGMSDIEDKIIRLNEGISYIAESVFKRILLTVTLDGYSMDNSVTDMFAKEEYLDKETYRKRFCEVLAYTVKSKDGWNGTIRLLNIFKNQFKCIEEVLNYTSNLDIGKKTPEFVRAYLFMVFAFMQIKGREIQGLFKDDANFDFYDSVCANLSIVPEKQKDFFEMKAKYGTEFMEQLFDVQEIWMNVVGTPYKRPSEKSFDMMGVLVSDNRFWTDGKTVRRRTQSVPIQENENLISIEGSVNVDDVLSQKYREEEYEDEPMEGEVEDTYIPQAENDTLPDEVPVQKKEVCIDDEVPEKQTEGGFSLDDLENYEREIKGQATVPQQEQVSPPSSQNKKQTGVINHERGHSSKVLMNGGN